MALSDLREIGFPAQVTRTKLAELLKERYPEHVWEEVYLLRGKYAQQKRLERAVSSLFPVRDYTFSFSFLSPCFIFFIL